MICDNNFRKTALKVGKLQKVNSCSPLNYPSGNKVTLEAIADMYQLYHG